MAPDSVPRVDRGFARRHDHEAVQCMCRLLQVEQTLCPSVLDTARMPLSLGGLGVGGFLMTRDAAHWDPTWQVLALGLRPPHSDDEREPSHASTVVQIPQRAGRVALTVPR